MSVKTLLKPAESTSAFLKMGIYGFAGSGKTYTATSVAIGLHKFIKSKKPIAFLDTETGLDFVLPRFKAAGIEVLAAKTRAFQDLLEFVREAESNCDIGIVDSVSHIWTDLLNGFMAKNKRTRLTFGDWGVIKPMWQRFTDIYLNSNLHFIICGRAQTTYDYFEGEDKKMELIKTGTKMRAETEMAFEPSLLVEMERIPIEESGSKKTKAGKIWKHRAYILKDRSDQIHGKVFDNPTFKNFQAPIEVLSLGKQQLGLDTERTSSDLFDENTGHPEWLIRKQQAQVALEEIESEVVKTFPSSSAAEKKAKVRLFEKVFETSSWTAITQKSVEELQAGLAQIRELLANPDEVAKLLNNPKKE